MRSIAYVSAEFGLAASVPQYSGGLGVLAGDHLKSAAALGVPITAVGLFYRHGYFRQQLDRGARQVERFPRLVPEMMAMQRVDDLHVEIPMGATSVRAAVWQVTVDTVPLYLLDSEVADNEAPDQLVTDRLYGGGSEQRIRQEMLLGVGGLRTLRALGTAPDVFHLNEGHAGFLALELIREAMHDRGLGYDDAVEFVRPSIVFTTHTPVPAGIDRFPRALIEHYLGWWCAATGRSLDDLMALGSEPGGDPDTFNLAAMSLRLAGWAGGVSELHGGVSRELFQSLWPQVSVHEVPITSVTNGVHGRTWVGDEMAALLHDTVGPDWAEADAEAQSNELLADEQRVLALFAVADTLKPDSAAAIAQLLAHRFALEVARQLHEQASHGHVAHRRADAQLGARGLDVRGEPRVERAPRGHDREIACERHVHRVPTRTHQHRLLERQRLRRCRRGPLRADRWRLRRHAGRRLSGRHRGHRRHTRSSLRTHQPVRPANRHCPR